MRLRYAISLVLLTLILLAAAGGCRWHAPGPPQPDPTDERPPLTNPGSAPPLAGEPDESFTTDTFEGLDEYRGRSVAPVAVNITRYFGPVNEDGQLRHPENIQAAQLTIRVWDLDSNHRSRPELLSLKLNGQMVAPAVTGLSDRWTVYTVPVPVESLRFPTGYSPVEPATNVVKIEFDAADGGWKAQVDWVRLTVRGVRPWVLVHGFLSDAATWRYWTEQYGPAAGIPTHAFSLPDPSGSIWVHGAEILNEIARARSRFGVSSVHLVGSSKGGTDGRVALMGSGRQVREFLTLASPHAGSELADLVKIGAMLHPWIGAVARIGEPGLTELTTWHARLALQRVSPNPHVAYWLHASTWLGGINPLLPGLDDGVVSVASAEALPYGLSLGRTENFHTENAREPAVFRMAAGRLQRAAESVELAGPGQAEPSSLSFSFITSAHLTSGEVRNWYVPVERDRPTTFALLWTRGAPSLSLYTGAGAPVSGEETRALEGSGFRYQLVRVERPDGAQLRAQVKAGPEAGPVLLAALIDSPVRLAAAIDPPSNSGPGRITVRFSHQERHPIRPQATIRYPDGTVDLIDLQPDPDLHETEVAIFSGLFERTGEHYGDIPVVIRAQPERAGDTARYLLTGFTLPAPKARLYWEKGAGPYDSNGDGDLDGFAATAHLEGFPPGRYILTGYLQAEGVQLPDLAEVTVAEGPAQTRFFWPASTLTHVEKEVLLGGLTAVDTEGQYVTSGQPVYLSLGASHFRPPLRIEAVGAPSVAAGVAAVPVTFRVEQAGAVTVTARLTDDAGRELGWRSVTGTVRAGTQRWLLTFPLPDSASGPYSVRDLSAYAVDAPAWFDFHPGVREGPES